MKYSTILVPLDGSSLAERALPVAARIAQSTGGSITLLQAERAPVEFESGQRLLSHGRFLYRRKSGRQRSAISPECVRRTSLRRPLSRFALSLGRQAQ
jgi:nucleotide-binding universal stress UspA family protein